MHRNLMVAVLLLVGCGASRSEPAGPRSVSDGVKHAADSGTVPVADRSSLARLHELVVVDTDAGKLFLLEGATLSALDVRTGETEWRMRGEVASIWPAGAYLVTEVGARGERSTALVLLNPASRTPAATCALSVGAPESAARFELEVFGYDGGVFARWRSMPPPGPLRGRAATRAEMTAHTEAVAAAYRCGLSSLSVGEGTCEVSEVDAATAGLDDCESRPLPASSTPATPAGDVALSVLREHKDLDPSRGVETIETLVASAGGVEQWRREIRRDVLPPPPP